MCTRKVHIHVCCVEVGRRSYILSVQIITDFVKVEIIAKMKIPSDERLKKQAQSDLKREQAIDIWRKKCL